MPPEFREMMQNPDFLRQITSPEVLQVTLESTFAQTCILYAAIDLIDERNRLDNDHHPADTCSPACFIGYAHFSSWTTNCSVCPCLHTEKFGYLSTLELSWRFTVIDTYVDVFFWVKWYLIQKSNSEWCSNRSTKADRCEFIAWLIWNTWWRPRWGHSWR